MIGSRVVISAVFFASLFVMQSRAQSCEKLIEKGRFAEALEKIELGLQTAPNDIELNFHKARVFFLAGQPLYNVDSAYLYFSKCEELLEKLRDNNLRAKLNKIPINLPVVRNQLNGLLRQEYERVEYINTIEVYDAFIARFPKTKFARSAREMRDQLFFKQFSEAAVTIDDYIRMHEQQPGSSTRLMVADRLVEMLKDSHRISDYEFFVTNFPDHGKYIEICYLLYEMIRKDGELKSLLHYYTLVPGLPLNERQKNDFYSARNAWRIGLTASKPGNSNCFGRADQQSEENIELNRRLSREGAQTGDLQFSLMWNNFNDIDLHVTDPFGEIIYFGNRNSASGGILDVDMNVRYMMGRYSDQAVENIYWPSGSAPSGHYKVGVVHYRNHKSEGCKDPTDFVVRIRCNGQDTLLKGSISYTEDKPRKLMYQFDYAMPEWNDREWNDTLMLEYDKYIKAAAPVELAYITVLRLMAPDIRAGQWDNALLTLANYSRYFVTDNAIMSRVRDVDLLLRDDRFTIRLECLQQVNTDAEEYSPVLSADEKLLYFCGRNRPDNPGKEDIFVSHTSGDGWGVASPLGFINTAEENEAPLSVSADGNTILLFRNGDIFFAKKTVSGWSRPQAFPEPINSVYWEGDAMLTSDGKAIIFASNREGGTNLFTEQNYYHGNSNYASDIYICEKTPDGWGPLIQPGSALNTMFCERSPFLHPDMKTLYFSSDGYYGLGDLDVYMIKRESDTSWTKWSKPVNLGRNINTADPDWGYQISASGEWAYFAAVNEKNATKEDIFRFRLPPALRPDPVIALSGTLTDRSGNPVQADVHWVDLSTGEDVGVSQSDPQTGNYFVLLTAGRNYGYYAESGTYFSVSDHLDLRQADHHKLITQDIRLYEMEQLASDGKALRINNLFFDSDKSTLRPESFPELDRLSQIIISYGNINVEIMGHTDDKGPDDYNQRLSQERAESVMQYLENMGVPAGRMKARGYGESQPLKPNTDDNNRQMNRRVEFRFSKMQQ